MPKVIIIDDEPLARALVREYLQEFPELEIVCESGDGFEGVKAIQQHRPDLIFLDVQMPKINGFEMLELTDPMPPVIFTTAFDEYAMKAFEIHAVDYLLKPFSKERFVKAVQKWQQSSATEAVQQLLETPQPQTGEHHRIVVRSGTSIRIIPMQDVIYIEAYDDYVKVFTQNDVFLKKKTLSYYEQTLPASEFLRVHRSYLIKLDQLTRVEPFEKNGHIALLKNGSKVPLSRNGYSRLREQLGI
ncbi:MAG: LytR/AlgR family response regulator transcription factor [Bacteroidota bacterium]|jgi:two-component system LytT family response regulator